MKYKYPRTFHLPWSLGKSDDDKVLQNTDMFMGQHITVFEKMDGENNTIYSDCSYHARSMGSKSMPWQSPVVSEVISKLYDDSGCILSDNRRIVIENMYAMHSIEYDNLKSYAYLLSVWEDDVCLSVDKLLYYSDRLEIPVPKILYSGLYDEEILIKLASGFDFNKSEGYVLRLSSSFSMNDFPTSVAKFVRKDHVQTDEHWSKNWKPNKLGDYYAK